ncbi:tetratricopeptide repeat protein [Mangrovibacillus cuniculi]|uniref:Tetratricopeptide repeat protein n=1 Tax=Mangrovibacillus cuniculi TaxID=2593652 RepID=A0A7S8CBS0_9BACI|nr:tetratricopeptide repeat protein [Mangrovibacillus cuniculi]QPC47087.1 tetratricopeptide repeat protein [Mangrovibacillus cuniculi]
MKRKPIKENVVMFPGTKKRLVEVGMERLEQRLYNEAVSLLEQAFSLDETDERTGQLLLMAYYENKNYQQANELASVFLSEGFDEYTDILNIYLLTLIQLHQYDKVYDVIKMLKEENVLPKEKEEHFLTLMSMSERIVREKEVSDSDGEISFVNSPVNEQMMMIAQLAKQNCRPFVNELKKVIESKEQHPFVQSMIIELFREQEIQEHCTVRKFNREKVIVPSQLANPFETKQAEELLSLLMGSNLESNPVLLEQLLEMVKRHLFVTYPIHQMFEPVSEWAAAYETYINSLYEGNNVTPQDEKQTFIHELEEKTFPNM